MKPGSQIDENAWARRGSGTRPGGASASGSAKTSRRKRCWSATISSTVSQGGPRPSTNISFDARPPAARSSAAKPADAWPSTTTSSVAMPASSADRHAYTAASANAYDAPVGGGVSP